VQTPFSEANAPARILVIRLGAVGDLVRTLPAVRELRRTWPESEIAWVLEAHVAQLLEGHPDIDRLIVYDRDKFIDEARRLRPKAARRLWQLRRELRDFGPQLTLDFQGCFKSGLASALSNAGVRIGFDRPHVREWSHLFANVRAPLLAAQRHRVMRAVALAHWAGAAPNGAPQADLALTPSERRRGAELVRDIVGERTAVALAPFSSERQAWKRYPCASWCEVARGLSREGYGVLILAGPGEEQDARELACEAGPNVFSCEGVRLRELAAVVAESSLLIGGDTGPMHIAWGVGTPVVALFGPTDPGLNAPFGQGHVSLFPERRTKRADRDKFPGITPERVLEAALGLLRGDPALTARR